jgi:hypothetical protein
MPVQFFLVFFDDAGKSLLFGGRLPELQQQFLIVWLRH